MATTNGAKARKPEAEKRRPVFEARYGRLRASVWRQESEKGPWFNVTLSRSYKDDDGNWQNSSSFGTRDLLEVAKLCNEVHTWIYRELAKDRAQNGQGGDAEPVDEEIPF
jgi:hypothetical protein